MAFVILAAWAGSAGAADLNTLICDPRPACEARCAHAPIAHRGACERAMRWGS